MVVTVDATKRSLVFIFPVTAILTAPATRLPPLMSTRMILKRSLLLGGSGRGSPVAAGTVAGAPPLASMLVEGEGTVVCDWILACDSGISIVFFPQAKGLVVAHRIIDL